MPVVAWKNMSALRGLAVFLVVVHHATVTVFALRQPLGPLESSALGPAELAVKALGSGLSRACIPAFLFASGFLLFRFCKTWKGAWGGLRPLAARYLLWSIGGYAVGWALGRVQPGEILPGILTGGPFAAYWFLVLIFQLYLLSPLLGRWVERRPGQVACAVLGLQLGASALFYLELSPSGPPAWAPSGRWFFLHLPFFLLGMLFSSRLAALQSYLHGRKRLIGTLCLALGVLVCLEGLFLGRLWGPEDRLLFLSGGQSLIVVLFSLLAILALAGAETRPGRIRGWCERAGASSLGILLTTDLSLQLVLRAFWKGSILLCGGAPGGDLPAPWLEPIAVWLLPVFVLAGILGPLLAIRLTGILLGRRAQAALFG